MIIDDDLAWQAILQARWAWRDPSSRRPVQAVSSSGATITLETGGRIEASATLSPEAQATLAIFAPIVAAPRLVIGQLGQSLDGRIATRTGSSHFINGPAGLLHLHRLRAVVDAVVVGAGTVAMDDPQLTVRRCPGENPARVVIDPAGRLPGHHRVFTDGLAPTHVVRDASSSTGRPGAISIEAGPEAIAPRDILTALAARGLHRILVEGGAKTLARFLRARALDRLHVVVAPLIIGAGRDAFALPGVDSLDQALRAPVGHHRLGDDMLFALDLS